MFLAKRIMTILTMKSNYIKRLKKEIIQQHNHALLSGELFFCNFLHFYNLAFLHFKSWTKATSKNW